jgi:hypothetical protein
VRNPRNTLDIQHGRQRHGLMLKALTFPCTAFEHYSRDSSTYLENHSRLCRVSQHNTTLFVITKQSQQFNPLRIGGTVFEDDKIARAKIDRQMD